MVEKKTAGQKCINFLFVVILVILSLSCLLPLLYNLAVSLSSKSAAEAVKVQKENVGNRPGRSCMQRSCKRAVCCYQC